MHDPIMGAGMMPSRTKKFTTFRLEHPSSIHMYFGKIFFLATAAYSLSLIPSKTSFLTFVYVSFMKVYYADVC